LASIVTAVILWPLVPKLLALPSPAQLRLAEAALRRKAASARGGGDAAHAQKDGSDRQLTGGVAHDFNNRSRSSAQYRDRPAQPQFLERGVTRPHDARHRQCRERRATGDHVDAAAACIGKAPAARSPLDTSIS